MPAAVLVPALISAAGTAGSLYMQAKAGKGGLSKSQQAMQDENLRLQNQAGAWNLAQRQKLAGAMAGRMPASLGGGPGGSLGYQATPGTTQALQALARSLPAPMARGGGGPGTNRIIWGDRRERQA